MEHSIDDLRTVVRTCPVIDNHAHNLLRPHGLRSTDFLTITTEAHGEALEDTPKSLAHIRAAKQLRTLYDLPPNADWETIIKERNRLLYEDADGLTRKCLEGTQTILIDDGLGSPDAFEPYQWHSKFTLSPCKRIVRIEAVAAAVLASLHQQWKLPVGISIADDEACSLAWVKFITAFEQAIALAISDPDVVGFKSVICYRAGLSVRTGRDSEVTDAGLRSFTHEFLPTCEARGFRVEGRGMCDALVISACKLIAAGFSERGRAKPLQFHTGLGDNDISLLDSNPAGLQSLIEAFPTVPVVLLHSAYPYTREAGYLATVYKNVYLDIGEVFPMVSRGGQEAIVRQAVELTPMSKVLWSTDGHLQAETYWLANVQGRRAIEKVFVELVEEEDLSVEQAIEAVEGILFNNSNVLYELGLRLPRTLDVAVGGTANTPMPSQQIQTAATVTAPIHDFSFIFVQWLDWMGMLRNRCIPGHKNLQPDQLSFGISRGNLGTLQNDSFTPVCNPVGQTYVRPDLDSLRPMYQGNLPGPAATIMASFEDETGQPLDLCPRSLLAETVTTLRSEHSLDLLLGFEIEITFCQRNPPSSSSSSSSSTTEPFSPLDTNHAWSTLSDTQYTTSLPLLLSITQALSAANLPITHLHSESGPGQYEFVLPPLPPVRAIDTLVQTRQAIQQIAATHHLRATVHPAPFPGAGTACHANLSFRRASASSNVNQVPELELEAQQSRFFAGVLARLRGLCAFTMPQGASYARVADDAWTCGRWVAWGTQNREVPLRRVGGAAARWEVRCLDGTGNAYLAVAAVLRAGLGALREGREMGVRECLVNPSGLTEGEREGLGIGERLPGSLGEALEALEGDEGLREAVGVEAVGHYVAMKKAEQEMLGGMEEGERRVWLMERY